MLLVEHTSISSTLNKVAMKMNRAEGLQNQKPQTSTYYKVSSLPMSAAAEDKAENRRISRLWCVAPNCGNTPKKCPQTSFHKFPTADKSRREEWINAVGRDGWEPSRSSVLCCNHFEMSQFRVPPGLSRRAMLKVDAVPTKFSKKVRNDSADVSGCIQRQAPKVKSKGAQKLQSIITWVGMFGPSSKPVDGVTRDSPSNKNHQLQRTTTATNMSLNTAHSKQRLRKSKNPTKHTFSDVNQPIQSG